MTIASTPLYEIKPPQLTRTIRIPAAVFSRAFTASSRIIPTGVKTYPVSLAHGMLAITNGSVVAQTFPAGILLTPPSPDHTTFTSVYEQLGKLYYQGYDKRISEITRRKAVIPSSL